MNPDGYTPRPVPSNDRPAPQEPLMMAVTITENDLRDMIEKDVAALSGIRGRLASGRVDQAWVNHYAELRRVLAQLGAPEAIR